MKNEKKLNDRIQDGEFIVTAEFLPRAETEGAALTAALEALKEVPAAVNVSDNPFGVAMSSLAASVLLERSGIEPIYQVVTRDRNRIAMQSDLLGAASLGIRNMLCLSGYHQVLTDNPESANVYDIDSTQFIAMVRKMREKGELLNGARITGAFPIITGAVANPYLAPLELNILRLTQKIDSGAVFIQTQAVFDVDAFKQWFAAAESAGCAKKAAILAGVLPLDGAEEAGELNAKYTEFQIPAAVIDRLKSAGDAAAQKKEGISICVETIKKLQAVQGLRGIHIISGGKEERLPDILRASGLSGSR